MNEWIDTSKKEHTDEQRNESKKSKYKEWNALHSWFYLTVPKLPYRVVGLEDFGCDTVKFTWSSTRLCNIFMTSPRWQFISCQYSTQYSTFLPLYSTEDKWFALLSLGISCSNPPPPPPDSPPPLLSRQMMSEKRKKHDSTWYFKNSLLRHSLHVETHARKLTILGCLSPPKDFPNSISCANDSCSWSEQLPVIVMCRQRNR